MTSAPEVEISVVVPAHNAAATIDACLTSLVSQDFPSDKFEIIVVENGSSDDTTARIRNHPVRLIESPHKGQYRAINRGIEEAQGQFLALIDADCRASSSWLRSLCEAFTEPEIGGCGGPLRTASEQTLVEQYTVYRRILDQEKMLQDQPCSPPFIVTANAMFRMSVVRQLGGFDPNLVPGDADFSWRMQWAGWRLKYVPDAVVDHFHRTSVRALWEQVTRYGEGNAELFKKHHARFGRSVWIDPMPYVWGVKALLKIPYARLTGRTPLEKSLPYFDLIANAGLINGKISGSIKKRIVVL